MNLTAALFNDVDPTNAQFRLVDMSGVVIRNAVLENAEINGEIKGHRCLGAARHAGGVVTLGPSRSSTRGVGPIRTPQDLGAQASLDEVLALGADRMATVTRVLADRTDERLEDMTEAVLDPGFPESVSFPVLQCVGAVVKEEWAHRLDAERNLDISAERS